MTRHATWAPLATLATLLAACTGERSASRGLVVVGGTLIDGKGGPPIPNALVVLDGEREGAMRVTAAGPQALVPMPKGYAVLDARGKFILPPIDTERDAVAARVAAGSTPIAAIEGLLREPASAGRGLVAIAEGAPANLLILDTDPVIDVKALERVHRHVRGGCVARPGTADCP